MAGVDLLSFRGGGVAVVIGATGGVGAAMAAALEASGRFDRVLKLGRHTDPPLDLLDEASIARAAAWVEGEGAMRLVFDATGVLANGGRMPERTLKEITPEALAEQFAINAIGPALLFKHFAPRLAREGKSVMATLSARVGSIGDNRLGGWYGYRAAKAALNQLTRTAAVELRRSRPHACLIALHPGTVATPLSAPFHKHGLEVRPPAEAAARLMLVLDQVGPELSGSFLDPLGQPIPW